MHERQTDDFVGLSRVLRLTPKKVGGLIAGQFAVGGLGALILLNFEQIVFDFLYRRIRVVTIDIHMGCLVLPENILFRSPLVGGLVEDKSHIVRSVTTVFQRPGSFSFVVHNVDSDLVLVRESGIVRPGLIDL